MADYRDLAAALGGGYGQDTGPITPDTLLTLKNGKTASAGDLLGLLKGYGQAVGSNLESLGRGGVASVIGAGGDLESLGRMGINKLYGAGGVNVNPTPVLPTTTDILGMMPRATVPRPETAGMEELGGFMTPATAKVVGKAIKATEGLPVGMSIKAVKAPQEAALELAKQNAMQTGQSLDPYPRSLQQGYEHDWYHGSTGDITNFNPNLLGEATGAQSAKKGFFFARDPQNPPESMMTRTTDQSSIDMLKKLGIPDDQIAKLNKVSMEGHGAETASGYAQIGGSREYREAMRKAKSAEKRGDWNEHDKQMQIAEDSEIQRMQEAQSLVAKYGDARDTMTEKINQTFYNLQHPQAQAELLDKKYKELMPYGWYNSYSDAQLKGLKKEISQLVGEDAAKSAMNEIDKFRAVKNERALIEKTQTGGNVMPVALRYKNPMVHDFGGKSYREQTYSDLIDQALAGGHDALILKNTFDPGGGPAKLVDVGVVFKPDQIRSKFAAFDPLRKDVATAIAAGVALPDLLAAEKEDKQKKLSKALAK